MNKLGTVMKKITPNKIYTQRDVDKIRLEEYDKGYKNGYIHGSIDCSR